MERLFISISKEKNTLMTGFVVQGNIYIFLWAIKYFCIIFMIIKHIFTPITVM